MFVVLKSPVDLADCAVLIGVFSTSNLARQACKGAGTYLISPVEPDRLYREGEVMDCETVVILDHREVFRAA